MSRVFFLQSLDAFEEIWKSTSLFLQDPHFEKQLEVIETIKDFVLKHRDCFERELARGHITGSAFVISSDFQALLLMHHAKLKKWLQLGGHADGHHLIHEVAFREVQEESGLTSMEFFPFLIKNSMPVPFDFDIHCIPDTSREKAHFHYDIRYLLVASQEIPLKKNKESLDLRWIPLGDISLYTNETSILRPLDKLKFLRHSLSF